MKINQFQAMKQAQEKITMVSENVFAHSWQFNILTYDIFLTKGR